MKSPMDFLYLFFDRIFSNLLNRTAQLSSQVFLAATVYMIPKILSYKLRLISPKRDRLVPEMDIYRMLLGADLNRELLVKINTRRLVYF
jgi:hypothetical protein